MRRPHPLDALAPELESRMSSSTTARALGVGAIAVFVIVAALLFGGGSMSGILSTVGSSIGSAGAAFAPAARPAQNGSGTQDQSVPGVAPANGGAADGGTTPVLYDPRTPDLQIIKTGTLALQVGGVDAALATATQKIGSLGGYASGSQRQGDGDSASASVIYRIPANRWDDALVALRALGTKVLGEQSQTEDVTTQVVDLGARITNLQATEQALQSIMVKATKIADVLAVQDQLTKVRGDIEQATAERKHLTEQAAFSTLSVTYSLREQAVLATTKKFDPGTEVDRASASLVDVFQAVATAGIWFGIVWLPILIGLSILAGLAVFVARRTLWNRPGGPAAGSWPDAPAGPTAAPAAEG
jgi:hypothetical protein